jgi:hypothetical protein
MIGVATYVEDALTFKLLTSYQKVVFRSVISSALDPTRRHKRFAPFGGEGTNHDGDKIFVSSYLEIPASDSPIVTRHMTTVF